MIEKYSIKVVFNIYMIIKIKIKIKCLKGTDGTYIDICIANNP